MKDASKTKSSVVAERLAAFVGKTIALRVSWDAHADIVGVFVTLEPLGRDYFIRLRAGDRERLISIAQVFELSEVLS